MKIAMISSPFIGGSIKTYIGSVASVLAAQFDITILIDSSDDSYFHGLCDTARVIALPTANASGDSYLDAVLAYLAGKQWDVIEVFNHPDFIIPISRVAPRARLVLSAHNDVLIPDKPCSEAFTVKHRVANKHAGRMVLEKLSGVVCISKFVRDEILATYPGYDRPLFPILSGVDLRMFTCRSETAREHIQTLKSQLLPGKHGPVILSISRLIEDKGVHLVIDAMHGVKKRFPDAVLVIIGSEWYGRHDESPYVSTLKALAEPLQDSIVFTSFINYKKMPEYFLIGDICVCASQWEEPLARIHYEAMAAGMPIVTTDRGGNLEVIETCMNGLIARPYHQAAAFEQSIIYLLERPALRQAMGERGRELASTRYNWDRVANELRDVMAAVTSNDHSLSLVS